MITDDELLIIHNAIQSGVDAHMPYGTVLPLKIKNGLKQISYGGILFMEQNTKKASIYTNLVKQGHKITWGIRKGNWIRIMDGNVQQK